MEKQIILFFVILFVSIEVCYLLSVNQTGVCTKTNIDGSVWLSCCAGYRLNSNYECEACPLGTYGENCKNRCFQNYYGLRCRMKCDCNTDERCDREVGCVSEEYTTTNYQIYYNATMTKDNHSIYHSMLYGLPCVSAAVILVVACVVKQHFTRRVNRRAEYTNRGTVNIDSLYAMIDENNTTVGDHKGTYNPHDTRPGITAGTAGTLHNAGFANDDYIQPIYDYDQVSSDNSTWSSQPIYNNDPISNNSNTFRYNFNYQDDDCIYNNDTQYTNA